MLTENDSLKPGDMLSDSKRNRTVELLDRINPQGTDVAPYWLVENTLTGKKTAIRENRLVGKRWSKVKQ